MELLLKFAFITALISIVLGTEESEYVNHVPQPYNFGYEVKGKHGSHFRKEQSDGHGQVIGSYGYTDERGIYREVHYIADKAGFRAQIKTNEPGTANQDPAAVKLYSTAKFVEDDHGYTSQQSQHNDHQKHLKERHSPVSLQEPLMQHKNHQHGYHRNLQELEGSPTKSDGYDYRRRGAMFRNRKGDHGGHER